MKQENQNTVTEYSCSRCDKVVDLKLKRCPYCGHLLNLLRITTKQR